jgi:hypothetical protein
MINWTIWIIRLSQKKHHFDNLCEFVAFGAQHYNEW